MAAGDVHEELPAVDEDHLSTMTAVYTRACWHAIRGGDGLGMALDDLATVSAMPGFTDWARHDPSFHVFRTTAPPADRRRYRDLVGLALPVAFADLPPLRAHAGELRKLDVATPAELLRENPEDLARELKVTVARVRRWQALAALAMLRSRSGGEPLTAAALSLLLAAGVDSVDALRAVTRQDAVFRARLQAVIDEQAADYRIEDIDQIDIPPRRDRFWRRLTAA
ncbi:DUF4332 domain-containing protein [Actinoplanes sp. NPDC026619]|uniref:DUF4332 domain-containing protein n=1 Tax=Actinoplanes sp. NPDC026619 TaxID=3155798 RepID=UPI003409BE47